MEGWEYAKKLIPTRTSKQSFRETGENLLVTYMFNC